MLSARLTAASEKIGARLIETMAQLKDVPVTHGMRYATSGGKRLRGFLVLEAAAIHGLDWAAALDAAAAIECMHAYSLVHDDLPCMDDDDLRRGQPTVHVKWDEATAVLVGDALQCHAFQLLADPACHDDASVRISLIEKLAMAAGASGMVLGQALDIEAEQAVDALTLEQITELQGAKTGALIRWSAEAGAILAEADTGPMRRYAAALGLAFQIADDILDVTGSTETTGKRVGKDAAAGKATFVGLLGLEPARRRAQQLVDEAIGELDEFGPKADGLRACARFVISRQN